MTFHLGFTGTRAGMSHSQWIKIRELVQELPPPVIFYAHHGDCVGADAQFHDLCRDTGGRAFIEVHPPNVRRLRAFCIGDRIHDPAPFLRRNSAIVHASQVMIAAPMEDEIQPTGGTWATVRMALRALRIGKLQALHVVGRDGQILDHARWQA